MSVLRETHFCTAEEFVDALRPRSDIWEGEPRSWIFRGQENADWPLMASALRASNVAISSEVADQSNHTGPKTLVLDRGTLWVNEVIELTQFFSEADERALNLPDHTFAARSLSWIGDQVFGARTNSDGSLRRFNTKFLNEFEDWPMLEVLGVLALAQHYGVRTRLLDWTRRLPVAAYFAAKASALEADEKGDLAVWAIRQEFVARGFPPQAPAQLPRVQLVTAPLASNPNMAAQAGLFTLDRTKEPKRLDTTLAEQAQRLKPEFSRLADPAIQKFVLPRIQARRLLQLLALEDVHGASLFPGFSGIAILLGERRLYS
jgi:hypothetical protein